MKWQIRKHCTRHLTITIKITNIHTLSQQPHFWGFIPQNLQKENDIRTNLFDKRGEIIQESLIVEGYTGYVAAMPWTTLQPEERIKKPPVSWFGRHPKNARYGIVWKVCFLSKKEKIENIYHLLVSPWRLSGLRD